MNCPNKADVQDSIFHPFNSMKVLLWRQHLEGMATGKLLPPVTVDFDPSNRCNSFCLWCNSRGFRNENQDSMTTEHMLELADFLAKWGVKSACMPKGQMISTRNGIKPIEEIKIGDEVLTKTGEYHRVCNTFKREFKGDIYSIKVAGDIIKLTEDHKILCVEPIKCISHCKRLCRPPCGRPCDSEMTFHEYKIIEKLASKMHGSELLLFPINERIENVLHMTLENKHLHHTAHKIPNKIKVDRNFLQIAGWYIAEGSTYNGKIQFCLNRKELFYATIIVKAMEKVFGLKCKITFPKKTVCVVEVGCTNLAHYFNKWFGKGAENKKIPEWLMYLPPQKQLFLLKSLWLGDGSFSKGGKREDGRDGKRCSYATISSTLFQQIIMLLLRQGVTPSLVSNEAKYRNGCNHRKAYFIYLQGSHAKWLIKLLTNRSEYIGYPDDNYKNHTLWNIDGNKYWCRKIMNISKEYTKIMVYNFEVEKEHNYTTLSIILKNCVAGGGEPMLNNGTVELLRKMKKVGIKTGVITNGIYMTDEQREAIVDCSSWCGFSIDAGTRKSFEAVHQVDAFDKVIENFRKLILLRNDKKSELQITYKFLLHPLNANTIYSAASLAKILGADLFQARPVCWDNLYGQPKRDPIDYRPVVDIINQQMEEASLLTDENFRFFGIRHKFGSSFERKVEFERCLATPIMAVYCADGTVQMCHDNRGKKEWILCRHDDPEEILKVWGSEKHLKLIKSIDPNKCPRCFIGTTPVFTKDGIKNISDIKLGDLVFTHKSRFKKVLERYERNYIGDGYKIKVYGNKDEIICTSEHPFLVITPKKCDYNYKKQKCFTDCNFYKYRKERGCKDECSKFFGGYSPVWKKACELNKNDFLFIPKYIRSGKRKKMKISNFVKGYVVKDGCIYPKKGRKDQRKYIPNEVNLSNFLKLAGYYLAEGYGKECVRFSFNKKEVRYVTEVEKLLRNEFNIKKLRRTTRMNVTEVCAESYVLSDLFSMFGTGAKNKKIPYWIFNLDKKFIKTFIQYYWRGDGCYREDYGVIFSTASKNLAYQLRLLLTKLGIISHVRWSKSHGNIKARHSLSGKPYDIKESVLWNVICTNQKSKIKSLLKMKNDRVFNTRERNHLNETPEGFFVPLRKLERVKLEEKVFNLEVEDDNSYIVENVVAHNCTFGRYNEIIENVIIKDKMCRDFP